MAIARFLDPMCLALRASGLWLCYAMLQNLIPSFSWIAPMPSTLAQSKERKGSNFAIWQPCKKDDCGDNSDEDSQTCGDDCAGSDQHFRCPDGECIWKGYQCDGRPASRRKQRAQFTSCTKKCRITILRRSYRIGRFGNV